MARYGRDFDRDRWDMRGEDEGMGGQGFYGGSDRYGSHRRGGQGGGWGGESYGGQGWSGHSGGMGSDAQDYGDWSGAYHRGRSGFGTGGGSYDTDYGSGWAGNPGSWRTGGLSRSGYGGEYYSGASYGYDTGGGTRDHGGNGRDFESGGGMGNDWGARDTGWGGGTQRGGGWSGTGGGQQDETRRMRAVDIMTENPECVTPEMSLSEAAQKMRDLDVGIIPVVDSEQNRRLRGVVTDRDIAIRAVAEGMDARSTKVSAVMTTEVESCNKNDTVGDILRVMDREQVRRVPITDREGRLVGIVAQADVVRDVDGERGEHRVNDTLEHISEPTRGGMQRGSQSRGGYGASNGYGSGAGYPGRSSGSASGMGGGMGARGTQRTGAEGTGGSASQGSRGGSELRWSSGGAGNGLEEGNNWSGGNETA